MKDSIGLPPNFKNPFAEQNPDEVWGKLKKAPNPLTREEENLLKSGKISLAQIKDKRNNNL